ncbi:MAG: disulfide reductase [Acidobacteria bacterium]|nr:MAG: disulfide reductase [Acidobacteriota bacterium]
MTSHGRRYAFYPGCSLELNAAAYGSSIHAVAERLGLELVEIDDWNCCGATEYWTQEKLASCAIVARNLALVPDGTEQVTAPCAACFLNLAKVDELMRENSRLAARVNEALAAGGLTYEPGRVRVRHLLDVLTCDVGERAIREQVRRPLDGLRVAPYYGCQIVRPHGGFDNPEYPSKMDRLLSWLGAEVVDYPVKSHCCGGHMTQISEPLALELIHRLLRAAAQYRADVIACMCPMCQLNLDAYQGRVNSQFGTNYRLPVLFVTQIVGYAFGLDPEELGLGLELVEAAPVLRRKVAAGKGG